jgi:hypothetical protein
MEFAGRKAANVTDTATQRLSRLLGLAFSVWFFSAGNLSSSLSQRPETPELPSAEQKRNPEFD